MPDDKECGRDAYASGGIIVREIIAAKGLVQETAVVEDGRLVEFVRDESDAIADTVILGRVERIAPGLRAAFVDIGEEKNGFLPLEETHFEAEKLNTGDRVLVQVKREAAGNKGAFLSRDIALAGSYVILLPKSRYVGVSSRITYEPRREELKEMGEHLSGNAFGLVMRTSSENADDYLIRGEIRSLWKTWEELARVAATAHAPSLIYQKTGTAEQLLIDYIPSGVESLTTNISELYENYHRKMNVYFTQDDPIKARGLDRERDRALDRKVWLKSGGNLIIDECEALTVIDVNTAKSTGSKQDRQILIRTNLEACHEIARQVRLRNLGGIILIDMIDMQTDEERAIVLDALTMDFQQDRVKTVIHGFTSLGLIEMTRRRTKKSLRNNYGHICPVCHGAGFLPDQKDSAIFSSGVESVPHVSDQHRDETEEKTDGERNGDEKQV